MDEIKKEEVVVEVDQRDALAKTLGAVARAEVDGKRMYFKIPTRNIIGITFAQRKVNEIQAMETLARGSAIREVSDMEILDKDTLFLSIIADVAELLELIELKKSTYLVL